MIAILGKDRKYVKLHKHDSWSVDYTLAFIAAPLLRQLRETTHSIGMIEQEDRPEHLLGTKLLNDEYCEMAWDWALTEMIFAFESKIDDDWFAQARDEERIANGFRLFGKYYQSLWD